MSCTPPTKIDPITIHSSAGSQPNSSPARIGPTIGPAAAIAEKCCGNSSAVEMGSKSMPSRCATAGTGALASRRNRRAKSRP